MRDIESDLQKLTITALKPDALEGRTSNDEKLAQNIRRRPEHRMPPGLRR